MNSISIESQKSGVTILRINSPESEENYISEQCIQKLDEFLESIDKQMDMVESDDEIKAVIVLSGKEGSFISGPLYSEYLDFTLADEGRSYCLKLQDLCDKIENSRTPFVAAISGACMGIGLEFALACNYRIACSSEKTALAMNQIDYGLIPSAGGMQRLSKLLGTKKALDLLLSDDPLDAEDSFDLGLIDELVPAELLTGISEARALELISKHSLAKKLNLKSIPGSLINENPVARKMLYKKIRSEIRPTRLDTNNASMMAVEALEISAASKSRGLHAESVYFGELAVTGYAKQLMKTEIAVQEVRKNSKRPGELSEPTKAAVIGNTQGAVKLASLLADKGIAIRFKCSDDQAAGLMLRGCRDYYSSKYQDYAMKEIIIEKKQDLLSPTTDYSGFKRAGIIIESEPDELELKKDVLSEAQAASSDNAVYITNSFTLPLSLIAQDSIRASKVIGINMLGIMNETDLLEICTSDKTSEETIAEVVQLSKRLGKIPLVENDGAGFYTSRVWLAYLNEAVHLLGEGVLFDDIEEAMTDYGFSEGPLSAIDEMGIKTIHDGLCVLSSHHGERFKPHPYLELMIQDQRLGESVLKGFYKYVKDEKRFDKSIYKILALKEKEIESVSHDYVQERLLLAVVNESLICLEQGVITGALEADVACVLGLGYPKHRGGPFRYIDSGGAAETLKKLHNLSIKHGARYTAPPLLKETAVGPNRFYQD